MIKFWQQLLTGPDGQADEMAVLCILSTMTFLGAGSWAVVVNHQPFDAQAWGIGLGALIGASSAGMGYKNAKETNNVAQPPRQ